MQTCALIDKLCGLVELYNRSKGTLIQFSLLQHKVLELKASYLKSIERKQVC